MAPHPRRQQVIAAASAVLLRGEQVLLVLRAAGAAQGLWSLPGGHVEPGESARDAALREVIEETGLGAELHGSLGEHRITVASADGRTLCYAIEVFYGTPLPGEPHAGGDAAEARFTPLSDLPGASLTPGAEAFIARAVALCGEHERRAVRSP